MPNKPLPQNPNLQHLKFQARDLLKAFRAGDRLALQRIREFHPRFANLSDSEIREGAFSLSDAQTTLAREHRFSTWAQLKADVESGSPTGLSYEERITDPEFKTAVSLLDAGDAEGLKRHLNAHPQLALQRVFFDAGPYFGNPSLLEFVAENPIRHETLPPNIVELATIILEAGAKRDPRIIDGALGLVGSGRVVRECGVQVPLIDLFCRYGAKPATAMPAALTEGEFEAAEALIRNGAPISLSVAAATRRPISHLLVQASDHEKHEALAHAARLGRVEAVKELLTAGVPANAYNPKGCHSHSTPLHQAALYGHEEIVRLLLAHGADRSLRDAIFNGAPADWAEHAGFSEIAELLRGDLQNRKP